MVHIKIDFSEHNECIYHAFYKRESDLERHQREYLKCVTNIRGGFSEKKDTSRHYFCLQNKNNTITKTKQESACYISIFQMKANIQRVYKIISEYMTVGLWFGLYCMFLRPAYQSIYVAHAVWRTCFLRHLAVHAASTFSS